MFGLNSIIGTAVTAVFLKFPEVTKNYDGNKFMIFELSNMISEELQRKHGKLFFDDYVKDFVEVKELNCGDFVQMKDNTNEELFTRLPNLDGTVDLYMNQKMFDKSVEPFCRKDFEKND